MSLYPSASFLSKNQLAKEGPDSVAPVVIPALAPTLDKSLKGDRSLCPVRALRYYLDRTSDLRQNKELFFVSFKKGFDKDISPATISSWIKQTLTCFLWEVYFLWDWIQPSLPILRSGLRKGGGNFGRLPDYRLVLAVLDLLGIIWP